MDGSIMGDTVMFSFFVSNVFWELFGNVNYIQRSGGF